MQLNDEQQNAVRQWAENGLSLGDIQKKLQEDFDITATYMEVRFLVDDLNVTIKEEEKKEENKSSTLESATVTDNSSQTFDDGGVDHDDSDDDFGAEDDGLGIGGGNVSVTIDQIARPNTMVSGKTTFSDGETAEWYIDQLGQLGLDPTTPGYQPSQPDLMAFQKELQEAARKAGL